ncbi:MAG: hypothetical protein VYA51_14080 [Planctomycetota bacterium]|nr:hypothetical protein [Planctomycetota bacterium]MEC9049135.1 hypothetical protein [Planctomycetota bacterium]
MAALPILAAGYWCSLSSDVPEGFANRAALGEVTPRWGFDQWTSTTDEPMHLLSRLVHLAALHVPGATVGSVIWINLVCLLVLVDAIASVARRSICGDGPFDAHAAFLLVGLWFASPSWGATWLHGERVGALLAAAMFAVALRALHGHGRLALRGAGVVLLAALAPFAHVHGALLGFALAPALLARVRASDSKRAVAWLGSLLVVANVTAAISLRSSPGLSVGEADWFGALGDAPGATLVALLRGVGAAWFDLLPSSTTDELVLGGGTLLLPLLLSRSHNRSQTTRSQCAPWWSCWAFGLLIVVLGTVRYDGAPAVGSLREATYGSCFVPIGALGVLAVHFGRATMIAAFGALLVTTAQDWHRGIETLRLANMRAQGIAAEIALRDSVRGASLSKAVRSPAVWDRLQQRGWVPPLHEVTPDPAAAFDGPSDARGGIHGGGRHASSDGVKREQFTIEGYVRSSLRAAVQWVAVVAQAKAEPPRVVGYARPQFEGAGRDVRWKVRLSEPLVDGSTVRAVGYLVDHRAFVAMGPLFSLSDRRLVADKDR